MLSSALPWEPWFGLITTLRCAPCQCSASVLSLVVPTAPTAQTSLDDATATADSVEAFPSPRLGLGAMVHRVPLPCSMSAVGPFDACVSPTAQRSLGEAAAIPFSSPCWVVVSGLATIFQAPFTCAVAGMGVGLGVGLGVRLGVAVIVESCPPPEPASPPQPPNVPPHP